MIEIDGSFGEGGGQIVRTSLALSMVTGKPFTISRVRANRQKPGLLAQHLTAVKAAAAVCSAEVEGAQLGSSEFRFIPHEVVPGNFFFSTGTAGSTMLVLQTILPALMCASQPSSVVLQGGTHNPLAPPFEFLEKTFLPILACMGVKVSMELESFGFYPKGGGKVRAQIEPCGKLLPLDIGARRGEPVLAASVLLVNLPDHIARRELKVIEQVRPRPRSPHVVSATNSPGQGNAAFIFVTSHLSDDGSGQSGPGTTRGAPPSITETFSSLGARGVSAELVAERLVQEAGVYLQSKAAVGEHLTDQLLVPFALAGGGSFYTARVSEHATTNASVIERFLDVSFQIEQVEHFLWRLSVT